MLVVLTAHQIPVTVSGSAAYTWVAHSESTDATTPSKLLYMADNVSSEVGFTASFNTTGNFTNVWWRYGQYVMTTVDSASFSAEPVSDASGWDTLSWSKGPDDPGIGKVLSSGRKSISIRKPCY